MWTFPKCSGMLICSKRNIYSCVNIPEPVLVLTFLNQLQVSLVWMKSGMNIAEPTLVWTGFNHYEHWWWWWRWWWWWWFGQQIPMHMLQPDADCACQIIVRLRKTSIARLYVTWTYLTCLSEHCWTRFRVNVVGPVLVWVLLNPFLYEYC